MVLTDETRLHEFVSIVPMWRWELFICLYFLARDTRRIDYRCDDRRFWLSAHDCQVPTPTSQNLDLEHQIRIFEAAQLINCLEYLNAQFLICRSIYQKKGVFWEVGVGDWQSMQDSFFFEFADWRGLMTAIFGILESSAMQWYQGVTPTQEFIFHRHIYSLWLAVTFDYRHEEEEVRS